MSMEMKIRRLMKVIEICTFPSYIGAPAIASLGVLLLGYHGLVGDNVGLWFWLLTVGIAALGHVLPASAVCYAESILPPMHGEKNTSFISAVVFLLVSVALLWTVPSLGNPRMQLLIYVAYCVIMAAVLVARNVLSIVLLRKVNIFKNRKF